MFKAPDMTDANCEHQSEGADFDVFLDATSTEAADEQTLRDILQNPAAHKDNASSITLLIYHTKQDAKIAKRIVKTKLYVQLDLDDDDLIELLEAMLTHDDQALKNMIAADRMLYRKLAKYDMLDALGDVTISRNVLRMSMSAPISSISALFSRTELRVRAQSHSAIRNGFSNSEAIAACLRQCRAEALLRIHLLRGYEHHQDLHLITQLYHLLPRIDKKTVFDPHVILDIFKASGYGNYLHAINGIQGSIGYLSETCRKLFAGTLMNASDSDIDYKPLLNMIQMIRKHVLKLLGTYCEEAHTFVHLKQASLTNLYEAIHALNQTLKDDSGLKSLMVNILGDRVQYDTFLYEMLNVTESLSYLKLLVLLEQPAPRNMDPTDERSGYVPGQWYSISSV